ncbi:MAG: hypothetical protein PW792_11730 [Acidobacteriaceae bacterium]|nr:hypothetical protein [Acidobacteriaceae bacterium]
MVFADFLKSPGPGFVESVVTFADHRFAGGVVDRFADFFGAFFVELFFAAFPVAIGYTFPSLTGCDAISGDDG